MGKYDWLLNATDEQLSEADNIVKRGNADDAEKSDKSKESTNSDRQKSNSEDT